MSRTTSIDRPHVIEQDGHKYIVMMAGVIIPVKDDEEIDSLTVVPGQVFYHPKKEGEDSHPEGFIEGRIQHTSIYPYVSKADTLEQVGEELEDNYLRDLPRMKASMHYPGADE